MSTKEEEGTNEGTADALKVALESATEALKEAQKQQQPQQPIKTDVDQVIESMPKAMQETLRTIVADDALNESVKAMMERCFEFRSPTAALLAGVALNRGARMMLEAKIDEMSANNIEKLAGKTPKELIIGSGVHAAIYSAVRVAMGCEKPVVFERNSRVGGAFACSVGPGFYLNSKNRPGFLSIPGAKGALNFIPGAPFQPSDISGAEYMTNNDIAFVIRMTLAMSSDLYVGADAQKIAPTAGGFIVSTKNGAFKAKRIIVATGLTNPVSMESKSVAVKEFFEFMAMLDNPFPFRKIKRVAVLGTGDAGKTVVEALTGQGPPNSWSVAALDWPDEIDWYGASFSDGTSFCTENPRARYAGIAKLLPELNNPTRPYRVKPINNNANAVSAGFGCVYVDERPYDLVVSCLGYQGKPSVDLSKFTADAATQMFAGEVVDKRPVARKVIDGLFIVGPAAQLEQTAAEQAALANAALIPENQTAMFRYAPRTAALAANLPK